MKKSLFLFTALVASILVSKILEEPDSHTTKKRDGLMAISTLGREGHNVKDPKIKTEMEQSSQFGNGQYGDSNSPQLRNGFHNVLDERQVVAKTFDPK
ncbi:hypothetical protein [Flagellimonas halotolerans]|uniref:Uncharacterized protein n=1 Tax=Flagellimonas halotolerans TaxID=3112164 RepID=A0ABU6IM18_9FLAO|nr:MULTISPECIES: hypothetical protein [unclassified Allomuricauda]MEC3964291.1 hypothetical protein [Muricauda sp. SYSU M86414]MEC4264161.1 hypothetical protein [Muricauda sp. SYSU M84420]